MNTAKEEREAAARGEGCLGKAADDEPVFILRSTDKFAPILVDLWCEFVRAAGKAPDDPKLIEALLLAQKMRRWQARNWSKKKVPD